MWILAIICVVACVLWYSNQRRAQRFVRAVHFLELLDGGANPDEANGKVARMFTKYSTPDADVAAIEYATDKAKRFTNGKQLPWIDDARQRGFTIDSGNTRFDLAHLSRTQPKTNTDQDLSGHFSEGRSSIAAGAQFPHAPPELTKAYHAGRAIMEVQTGKVVPALKALARAAIRWAFRGALAGFVIGLFVPRVGVFGDLEVWAVPILTAYFGALAGLTIGAAYRFLRWVYSG